MLTTARMLRALAAGIAASKTVSVLVFVTILFMVVAASHAATAEVHPRIDPADGWVPLLTSDLTGWVSLGQWTLNDGVLARKGGGDIWTKEQYGDFILDLEFKIDDPMSNSGVAIRVDKVPTLEDPAWYEEKALEVQIRGPGAQPPNERRGCGAMYDLVTPAKKAQKPVGQWNHYTIIARGPQITVVFNGERVVDMNLDRWTEIHKNPDGTCNRFTIPMKDMPARGHILLQDHDYPVWFRNVYIKEL